MRPPWSRWRPLALAAGLVAATLAAYASVAGNDFVHIDDNGYVTDNPHVQAGLVPATLRWAFTTTRAANWHPLTWLSHALDCQLFGLDPAGHHLTSLAIHAASAVWLFLLLRRATGSSGPSAFVAALFALHPLHVESVAWVAERKDVLSGLFWMATLHAYLRWVERPGAGRYAAIVACYALGLMAKPMLVTLPFTLLLLDSWPLGRTGTGFGRLVREKIPLFVLAAASSAVTFVVQRAEGAMDAGAAIPLGARIGNAIVSCVAYLGQTVWPAGLGIFYPHPRRADPVEVAACALVLAAASVFAWRTRRTRPYVAVGWLWYLGTLVPVIGIVQVGAQARADRYTYLPLVGISIAVAWGAADVASRWRHGRSALAAAALALAATWAVLTRAQVSHWRNDRTLFEREVVLFPGNAAAHGMLGMIHLREGRMERATAEFRAALELDPKYGEAHSNYGMILELQGKRNEALAEYAQAVACAPRLAEAQVNLGRLLAAAGKTQGAIEHLEAALRVNPDLAEAHQNLAAVLLGTGRRDEAILHLERAVELKPDLAGARKELEAARSPPKSR